jgi:hypothetical protein
MSFRRFVLGFYTPEFRELLFNEEPPQRMFHSLVTVFAGYWQPSLATRFWVRVFLLLVRLQRWVRFSRGASRPAEIRQERSVMD